MQYYASSNVVARFFSWHWPQTGCSSLDSLEICPTSIPQESRRMTVKCSKWENLRLGWKCFTPFHPSLGWDIKMGGRLYVLFNTDLSPLFSLSLLDFSQTDAKPSPATQAQSISEVYALHPQDIPWQWEAGSSVGKLHPVVCYVNRSCSPVSRGADCVVRRFSSSVRCGLWHYLLTFLNPSLSCFLEVCSQLSLWCYMKQSF